MLFRSAFGVIMCFPGSSAVKNPPAMQETLVRFLVWEDPLEEGMATRPIFLPGESLWTEEPGGLRSIGPQRVRHS